MTKQPSQYNYLKLVRFREFATWSVQAVLQPQKSYNDTFRLAKLGEVLERSKDDIIVQNEVLYKRVTIRLYNKGVTTRDEVYGKTIGTKKQFVVKQGQFLLSKIDARNGAFGLAPQEIHLAIVTTDFLAYNIRKDLINPVFLNLLTTTKHFHSICQQSSTGTTGRQRINEQKFLNFAIPLPPLDVQERLVAAHHDCTQEAVDCEREATETEQAIERYIMETLGIEITQTERKKGLQFVRFKDLERWDARAISRSIHSKYTVVAVGDVLTSICTGTTPPTHRKEYFDGDISFYTPSDLGTTMYLSNSDRHVTSAAVADKKARVFKQGTLLFVGIGSTVGKVGIITNKIATANQQITGLVFSSDHIITEYAYLYFSYNSFVTIQEKTQATLPIVNQEKIKKIPIPLPPLDVQAEIVETVSRMKSRIKELSDKTEMLRREAKEAFEKELFL